MKTTQKRRKPDRSRTDNSDLKIGRSPTYLPTESQSASPFEIPAPPGDRADTGNRLWAQTLGELGAPTGKRRKPDRTRSDGSKLEIGHRRTYTPAESHNASPFEVPQGPEDAAGAEDGYRAQTLGEPAAAAPEVPIAESLFTGRYPYLEELLRQKGLPLLGIYTYQDAAKILGASVTTIREWCRDGKLRSRRLPGRGRFLSQDLEDSLAGSLRHSESDEL
jgi:excisionase family DNA binding protein